ncbi:hypothetical protein GCM10017673_40070 [Streptosporangium violaceochromogenes]|nr:hypothetical protein GCM10017673_40070 [Streptosporangium violaceochromogenes]
MRSNKPADKPAPAPAVAWPSDEARYTFLQAVQTDWQDHLATVRDCRGKAEQLGAEIGAKTRELEQLRQHIDGRIEEKRRQDLYAAQAQAAADAVVAALTALGEQPPVVQDRLVAGGGPVSVQEHAAQFGGPLPENQAAAMDAFQALHNQQEPHDADPLGLRELALRQQHPYADPTPTGTHPLAQPEERPR